MPSLQALEIPPAVLALARAGDPAAQEAIYRSLSRPVYALIRRLVVRPAIAEELLQDVFVELLRSLKDFRNGAFLGWVRRIAISKSLMYLRSPWHRRLEWLDGSDAEPLSQEADPEHRDLEAALAQLTAVSRSVVWLHDVEGYTHGEIAAFFGRSVSFSKSQLARAHQQLKAHLDTDRGGLACTPLEELLMRRDRQPVPAEVEAHLQVCEQCRAELARLDALQAALQRLPTPLPPDGVFRRVRAQIDHGHDARRWPALASAAAVLLVVLVAFFAVTQRAGAPAGGRDGLEALVSRSQHLEAMLNALPPRPTVEQAATSATIDALQSRIELLDAQLSRAATGQTQPQVVERLWNDRVQLLNSLVYVRYAEAAGDSRGQARPLELGVI